MLANIIFLFLTSEVVLAQINGEFWWLNEKVAKLKGAVPPPVTFEDVSEFDTDESDKIVFADNNLNYNIDKKTQNLIDANTPATENKKWKAEFTFKDNSAIVWPVDIEEVNYNHNFNNILKQNVIQKKNASYPENGNEDIFEFIFPENENFILKDISNVTNSPPVSSDFKNDNINNSTMHKSIIIDNKITFKIEKDKIQSENICKYLKKRECNRHNGFIYNVENIKSTSKQQTDDNQLICCILPLPVKKLSKIYFPDSGDKRYKRSLKENVINPAQRQRNALLLRKYGSQIHRVNPTSSTTQTVITQKIVTPDDEYVDPYWNIKNSNFKKPGRRNNRYQSTNPKEYDYQDYSNDYVIELPKPGLVGLYSDHGQKLPSWTVTNGNTKPSYGSGDVSNDDESISSFGYSTIDPRLVDRMGIKSKPPKQTEPMKLTTDYSDEFTYDIESQTISYESIPDFQVLQGFKLPNLIRNKNKITSKNERQPSTTEAFIDYESIETITRPIIDKTSFETDYDDFFDIDKQIYNNCGKVLRKQTKDCGKDRQTGEVDAVSHPWLSIVVLTKNLHNILCYATIVHPRAAITAADCVNGRTSPGEITIITGLWDLKERNHAQQRMASIYLDTQNSPEDLTHILALLHWKRPLRLEVNVQPVCLGNPHVGDNCKFVGWGGYDQALSRRPHWQQGSILTPRECNERLTSNQKRNLLKDGFCASVESRNSVTGIGGSLVCDSGERQVAVGVAMCRDNVIILTPAQEWTALAIATLRLQ